MTSDEVFGYIRNEFNCIKEFIECNKDFGPGDVEYMLKKINNKLNDIQIDWETFNQTRYEEANMVESE